MGAVGLGLSRREGGRGGARASRSLGAWDLEPRRGRAAAESPLAPQTLDAWAAVACTELLTRDLLKPSPHAWLRAVKSLAVPLELLCSEGYLQGPEGRAGGLIRKVR